MSIYAVGPSGVSDEAAAPKAQPQAAGMTITEQLQMGSVGLSDEDRMKTQVKVRVCGHAITMSHLKVIFVAFLAICLLSVGWGADKVILPAVTGGGTVNMLAGGGTITCPSSKPMLCTDKICRLSLAQCPSICKTVDCGSHGVCVQGICVCNDGYKGTFCVDGSTAGQCIKGNGQALTDNFRDNDLGKKVNNKEWRGKTPDSHSAVIVADPKGQRGNVLKMARCTYSGDTFSVGTVSCTTGSPCLVSYRVLQMKGKAAFQGFSTGYPGAHMWTAAYKKYNANTAYVYKNLNKWEHVCYQWPPPTAKKMQWNCKTGANGQVPSGCSLSAPKNKLHLMLEEYGGANCGQVYWDSFFVVPANDYTNGCSTILKLNSLRVSFQSLVANSKLAASAQWQGKGGGVTSSAVVTADPMGARGNVLQITNCASGGDTFSQATYSCTLSNPCLVSYDVLQTTGSGAFQGFSTAYPGQQIWTASHSKNYPGVVAPITKVGQWQHICYVWPPPDMNPAKFMWNGKSPCTPGECSLQGQSNTIRIMLEANSLGANTRACGGVYFDNFVVIPASEVKSKCAAFQRTQPTPCPSPSPSRCDGSSSSVADFEAHVVGEKVSNKEWRGKLPTSHSAIVVADPKGQRGNVLKMGKCTYSGDTFSVGTVACSVNDPCVVSFYVMETKGGKGFQGFSYGYPGPHTWTAAYKPYKGVVKTFASDGDWVHVCYTWPPPKFNTMSWNCNHNDQTAIPGCSLGGSAVNLHIMLEEYGSAANCGGVYWDSFMIVKKSNFPNGCASLNTLTRSFQNFESLAANHKIASSAWRGKTAGSHSGAIVLDPKGERGNVLSLGRCDVSGDTFSIATFACSPTAPCIVTFDVLQTQGPAAWQGFSAGYPGAHTWTASHNLMGDKNHKVAAHITSDNNWQHMCYTWPPPGVSSMDWGSTGSVGDFAALHIMLEANSLGKTKTCGGVYFDNFVVLKASDWPKGCKALGVLACAASAGAGAASAVPPGSLSGQCTPNDPLSQTEDFEDNDLGHKINNKEWRGKTADSSSGVVVADPLDQHGNVLKLGACTYSGDTFSMGTVSCTARNPCVVSYSVLQMNGGAAYQGFSAGYPGPHTWTAAHKSTDGTTVVTLAATKKWQDVCYTWPSAASTSLHWNCKKGKTGATVAGCDISNGAATNALHIMLENANGAAGACGKVYWDQFLIVSKSSMPGACRTINARKQGTHNFEAMMVDHKIKNGALGVAQGWRGKTIGSHSGNIVSDPLGVRGNVLTMGGCTYGGDTFSTAGYSCTVKSPCVISFDVLQQQGPAAFVGMSSGFPGAHTWIASYNSKYAGVQVPISSKGQWQHVCMTWPPKNYKHMQMNAVAGKNICNGKTPDPSCNLDVATNSLHIMLETYSSTPIACRATFFDNFVVMPANLLPQKCASIGSPSVCPPPPPCGTTGPLESLAENFENKNQGSKISNKEWRGKSLDSSTAVVVADPEGQRGNVMKMGACTYSGDTFSVGTVSCTLASPCIVSYDVLQLQGGKAFQGFSTGFPGAHTWSAGYKQYAGVTHVFASSGNWEQVCYEWPPPGASMQWGCSKQAAGCPPAGCAACKTLNSVGGNRLHLMLEEWGAAPCGQVYWDSFLVVRKANVADGCNTLNSLRSSSVSFASQIASANGGLKQVVSANWRGSATGSAMSATIVQDPKGERGQVLHLASCTYSGDTFSTASYSCTTSNPCVVAFDVLQQNGNAAYQGFSAGYPGSHTWTSSYNKKYPGVVAPITSKGEWQHVCYSWPPKGVTKHAHANPGVTGDLTGKTNALHIMLEANCGGSKAYCNTGAAGGTGGACSGVYFDNLVVVPQTSYPNGCKGLDFLACSNAGASLGGSHTTCKGQNLISQADNFEDNELGRKVSNQEWRGKSADSHSALIVADPVKGSYKGNVLKMARCTYSGDTFSVGTVSCTIKNPCLVSYDVLQTLGGRAFQGFSTGYPDSHVWTAAYKQYNGNTKHVFAPSPAPGTTLTPSSWEHVCYLWPPPGAHLQWNCKKGTGATAVTDPACTLNPPNGGLNKLHIMLEEYGGAANCGGVYWDNFMIVPQKDFKSPNPSAVCATLLNVQNQQAKYNLATQIAGHKVGSSMWRGKTAGSHSSIVAQDPKNERGQVLQITGCGSAGDTFSTASYPCTWASPCIVSYDVLQNAGDAAFQGFSAGYPGAHAWTAAYKKYPGVIQSLSGHTGQWQHVCYTWPPRSMTTMVHGGCKCKKGAGSPGIACVMPPGCNLKVPPPTGCDPAFPTAGCVHLMVESYQGTKKACSAVYFTNFIVMPLKQLPRGCAALGKTTSSVCPPPPPPGCSANDKLSMSADFEHNVQGQRLSSRAWRGKQATSHSAVVAADPLGIRGNVMKMTGARSGGDTFSVGTVSCTVAQPCIVTYYVLQMSGQYAFQGFSAGFPGAHTWTASWKPPGFDGTTVFQLTSGKKQGVKPQWQYVCYAWPPPNQPTLHWGCKAGAGACKQSAADIAAGIAPDPSCACSTTTAGNKLHMVVEENNLGTKVSAGGVMSAGGVYWDSFMVVSSSNFPGGCTGAIAHLRTSYVDFASQVNGHKLSMTVGAGLGWRGKTTASHTAVSVTDPKGERGQVLQINGCASSGDTFSAGVLGTYSCTWGSPCVISFDVLQMQGTGAYQGFMEEPAAGLPWPGPETWTASYNAKYRGVVAPITSNGQWQHICYEWPPKSLEKHNWHCKGKNTQKCSLQVATNKLHLMIETNGGNKAACAGGVYWDNFVVIKKSVLPRGCAALGVLQCPGKRT